MSDEITDVIQHLAVPRYAPRIKPTPIPEAAWDDEPLICIQVNTEWASHIIGVLTALDQADTWIGDDSQIDDARAQVNQIMLAFMEDNCDTMSGCCPEPLQRITSDGVLEVSYDGGNTWATATTEDPRKTMPKLPDVDDGDDDKKCKAANRVVRQMKDQQTQWADSLGTGLTIVQLALAFAGAVIVFALSLEGLAAILYPALLTLAASVVGTGTAAYNDLFTDDVWGLLLCKLYCNCGDDGQFTQSQFLLIRTQLDGAGLDPTVALAFSSALNAWQVDGLNNAARTPTVDNLDCSDCDCTAEVFIWDELAGSSTQIFPDEDGIFTASSGVAQSGGYYVCSIFFQSDLPIPAHWKCWSLDVLSNPTGNEPFKYRCSDYSYDALATCVAQWTFRSAFSTFEIQFSIGDICGAV